MADLARTIATRREDRGRSETSAVRRLTLSLRHDHLPEMADSGVVDYDADRKQVELARGGLEPTGGRWDGSPTVGSRTRRRRGRRHRFSRR